VTSTALVSQRELTPGLSHPIKSETQLPYRKVQKSGVCIRVVLISALHVFPTYLRHQRQPTGMRDGLHKASVRTQKSPELLAPSARSLPNFRIQAHTTRAPFSTVTTAVLMPLPHHSGAPHSAQPPSHLPPDCPTTTAAGLITPAVLPGSHRRPTCNISLRKDRWRAPVVHLSLFASSLLRIAFIAKNVRLASMVNSNHRGGKRVQWSC